MTIYEELKTDHDQVQTLLNQLAASTHPESRRNLVKSVRDLLIPHSRAEEAVLYNVLRDLDESKNVIAHSYKEHFKAETLLRGLQVTEAVSMHWEKGVNKLKEELNHHIEEEETVVLSAAQRVLSDSEAEVLGSAFVELKQHIGTGIMSSQIKLIANLMPERFRKSYLERIDETIDETINETLAHTNKDESTDNRIDSRIAS